jgi:hypothetical protein
MSHSITTTAISVEEELNRMFSAKKNPFLMDSAQLYGVSVSDDETVSLTILASEPDVYELLEKPASNYSSKFLAFALITSGWAAPVEEDGTIDGAPGDQPLRRRVRLAVVANADTGVASVLRFSDEPDDVVTDPGSATGSLADAVLHFVAH